MSTSLPVIHPLRLPTTISAIFREAEHGFLYSGELRLFTLDETVNACPFAVPTVVKHAP
jgi:hypothetical protein